ncbi:MAG: hypothetical protein SEPTF4163_006266 [Sporothrix epigloea]
MDDIKLAPQQSAAVVEEQEVEIETKDERIDGESKGRQATDNTAKKEMAPGIELAPSTKDEPRQQRLLGRAQGRGRPKRFMKNSFNAPYIQQPSNIGKGEKDDRKRSDASPVAEDEKDEIVLSIQVPEHITLDSAFLHHDPPEPSPKSGPITGNPSVDKTPLTKMDSPPLALASHSDALPEFSKKLTVRSPLFSPPRRSRPLWMAGGKSSTTLYHLLMLINRTLAAEMKKNPDVKLALDPEIKGSLRDLGLLGRFVSLLFRAKSDYQMNAWRNKSDVRVALRQRERWTSNNNHTPQGPVFRGALAIYSVPLNQVDVRSPRQAGVRGDASESEDQDDGNQRFSALTTGVARKDSVIFDNGNDKDSLVWQEIKRADRRYCAAAKKRSQQEAFSSDDEESSTTSSENESAHELDYLSIASPSLPVRSKQADLFSQNDSLDPRRYETHPVPEQPEEEAAENKKQRREAKEIAKGERQARSKLIKQRQKEADADAQMRLATLTDGLVAALYVAETAVYEREELRDECDALRRENKQLTRKIENFDKSPLPPDALSKELAKVANEEAEKSKETKRTDDGIKHGSETGSKRTKPRDRVLPLSPVPTGRLPMKGLGHQLSRQPTTPLPPTMPNTPRTPLPWTPTAPVSDWNRWQIIDEIQHALCEKVPRTPPSTLAFLPIPSARRFFPAAIGVAYCTDTIRPPLGTGICLSALDVLLAVWLNIWRQIDNVFQVLRWAKFSLLERNYFVSMVVISSPWSWLRQLVSKQGRRELPTALTPAIRSPTSLAFRSRVTQLGQLYTPSTLSSAVRFPRDAMAELVVSALVILVMATSIVAVLAAVTERNFWQSANGNGEPQQWFMYHYQPEFSRNTGKYELSHSSLAGGPYQICGCVYTVVDLRMIKMLFGYLWVLFRAQFADVVSRIVRGVLRYAVTS